jgi:hypothetical protein
VIETSGRVNLTYIEGERLLIICTSNVSPATQLSFAKRRLSVSSSLLHSLARKAQQTVSPFCLTSRYEIPLLHLHYHPQRTLPTCIIATMTKLYTVLVALAALLAFALGLVPDHQVTEDLHLSPQRFEVLNRQVPGLCCLTR